MSYEIFNSDALDQLKTLSKNSIDSLITDPPAGIGIMNLKWDSDLGGRSEWTYWLTQIFKECHRVLKPGAFGLVWALPRRSHWTSISLEDSGFEIKDVIHHGFLNGFPKSLSLEKLILSARQENTDSIYKVTCWIRKRKEELGLINADLDKIAQVKGGSCHWTAIPPMKQAELPTPERWERLKLILGEAPEEVEKIIYSKPSFERKKLAQKWSGFGTSLKPAHEHWILVQKPTEEHNLTSNLLKWGVGGLNIDTSRIGTEDKIQATYNLFFRDHFIFENQSEGDSKVRRGIYSQHENGRFPANMVFSVAESSIDPFTALDSNSKPLRYFKTFDSPVLFCKKASAQERMGVCHPTQKPVQLMSYFCKLITPLNGTILDPFMGSGTTGVSALREGFRFVGIEKDSHYFQLAHGRIQKQFQKEDSSSLCS